jgi:hypothetical protein
VDNSGNVYIADARNKMIKKWSASDQTVQVLVSLIPSSSYAVAVDGPANVYFSDYSNNAIKEIPRAFVDSSSKTELPGAGSDSLPVLSATANLATPFSFTSDQAWLTISGTSNGVVHFNFAANDAGVTRTTHYRVGEIHYRHAIGFGRDGKHCQSSFDDHRRCDHRREFRSGCSEQHRDRQRWGGGAP